MRHTVNGGVRLTSPQLSLHDVEMEILSIHVQLCIHNLFSGSRIPFDASELN